jgi:hypothetical protein
MYNDIVQMFDTLIDLKSYYVRGETRRHHRWCRLACLVGNTPTRSSVIMTMSEAPAQLPLATPHETFL